MVLSADEERRSFGAVDGTLAPAFSGPAMDGEKETLYTGPAWPINLLELAGGGSLGFAGIIEGRGSPAKFQTRMYDSSVPAATRRLSSENSRHVMLEYS